MVYTLTKKAKANVEEDQEQDQPAGKFTLTKKGEGPSIGRQTLRGIGQGGLDILSLPALATYPIERGMQKVSGLEDEPGKLLPSQEIRYGLQHETLQKMEKGEAPSFGELMLLSDDDDLAPISYGGGTSLSNLQQLQEEIPEGGVFQEGVRRVTRSAPFALGGAGLLQEVLKSEFAGLAGKELVKYLGGTPEEQMTADLLLGLGTAFWKPKNASTVARAPEITVARAPEIAEGTGALAKAEAFAGPKVLEKRLLSLEDNIIKEADKRMTAVSKEALSDFEKFNSREVENLITRGNRSTLLDEISPIDKLPKQAWTDISSAANELYNSERQAYSALYNPVRKVAEKIKVQPTRSRAIATEQLKKLTNVETSPAGYSQVENLIRQVKKDLGIVVRDSTVPTSGQVVQEIVTKPISSDKLLDLSIRLGDAINFEALTPTIKDLLKPIREVLKDEFRETLKVKKPSALQAFNKAEESYKKTANRFGKDSIATLRTTENPEQLTDLFAKPSNFEALEKVFGKNNKVISEAERQIVDLIAKQSNKQALETLRNLEPLLSPKAKESAQKFINLGDKLTVPGQRRLFQQNMLDDVAQAITTGNRPEFTLRAMRIPQGYQATKEIISRTAQGKKLFKTLEKQVVQDLFNSITTEGRIDWNKARNILNDPGYESVMNQIMGIDGVQFIKNIEKYSNNITTNLMAKRAQSPTVFNKFYNTMSSTGKVALSAFLGNQFGILMGIATVFGGEALLKYGARLITNPKVRNALKKMADLRIEPSTLLRTVPIINDAIEE